MQETQRAVKTYENYIDGKWVAASSGETYETRNPAKTDEIVGRYPLSTAEDVDRAVEAAHRAFQEWRDIPAPERMEYVHSLIEVWRRRHDELAEAVTLEMGKPIREARTEVDRGIGEMRFTAGEALRVGGETLPSGRRDLLAYTVREPIGVVAAVTPWNFPVLSPIRKTIRALVHGCAVVLKPASLTPLTSVIIVEMLQEAGVPAGVVNLIIGRGGEVGDALVTHPRVNGVTFTGSTEVGLGIYEKVAPGNKKVQLEMGGKNGCVVAGCKDPKDAAAQIVAAAYQASGQRCTAISRVIVLEELEAALVEATKKLKVGRGLDEETTMGPLSSRNQLQRSIRYVDLAQKDGARVLLGGKEATGEASDQGHYYEPTILTDVKPGTPAAVDEIFGPVLVVTPVKDFEEALEVHNEVHYGLTSSIFTDDMDLAQAFVRGSEAGMLHVNNGTVSEGHMPFGGVKQSGMGAYGIGATNKEFFTKLKVVYHQHGDGEPAAGAAADRGGGPRVSNVGFRIFPPERAPRAVVKLYADFVTPNISDNMNRINGACAAIRSLHGREKLLGSAFTVRTWPGDNLIVHKALDMLRPGDVLVVDAGGDTTNAILGEIMMRIAIRNGATGIVVDGAIRDAAAFSEAGFPCFARGATHRGPYKDGPGEISVPITVGGAIVRPGDVVVGDADGVVVVPLEEAEELAEKVRKIVEKEAVMMREIDEGTIDRSWVDRTLEQRGCQWIGFEGA